MTKANRTKPYSNKGGVRQYIEVKQFRSDYTFSITCEGECFYNVNGNKIPEDQFNDMFPLQSINSNNEKGTRIGSPQQIY